MLDAVGSDNTSLEINIQPGTPEHQCMLDVLDKLEINLAEAKDALTNAGSDHNPFSNSGLPVDPKTRRAEMREYAAFRETVYDEYPGVFKLWKKLRDIAHTIDRMHGIVMSL